MTAGDRLGIPNALPALSFVAPAAYDLPRYLPIAAVRTMKQCRFPPSRGHFMGTNPGPAF